MSLTKDLLALRLRLKAEQRRLPRESGTEITDVGGHRFVGREVRASVGNCSVRCTSFRFHREESDVGVLDHIGAREFIPGPTHIETEFVGSDREVEIFEGALRHNLKVEFSSERDSFIKVHLHVVDVRHTTDVPGDFFVRLTGVQVDG